MSIYVCIMIKICVIRLFCAGREILPSAITFADAKEILYHNLYLVATRNYAKHSSTCFMLRVTMRRARRRRDSDSILEQRLRQYYVSHG